jgi:hypothetical protein
MHNMREGWASQTLTSIEENTAAMHILRRRSLTTRCSCSIDYRLQTEDAAAMHILLRFRSRQSAVIHIMCGAPNSFE